MPAPNPRVEAMVVVIGVKGGYKPLSSHIFNILNITNPWKEQWYSSQSGVSVKWQRDELEESGRRMLAPMTESFPKKSSYELAVTDFSDGLRVYPMWMFLAWQEIVARYRRSVLGPFWITLNMAIMIFTMGPIYSSLFGQDLKTYYVFLSTSVVIWGLISALVNESCAAFIGAEGFVKQMKLPFSLFIFKMVWKNIIIFFHNFLVVLIIFFFFPPDIGIHVLLVPFTLLLVCLNAIWFGTILAVVSARFRDIPQIVNSFMGVAFFITPVMWQPSLLVGREWVMNANPLFHFMEIVRGPLIYNTMNYNSLQIVCISTLVGYALMFYVFQRHRARIAYWL